MTKLLLNPNGHRKGLFEKNKKLENLQLFFWTLCDRAFQPRAVRYLTHSGQNVTALSAVTVLTPWVYLDSQWQKSERTSLQWRLPAKLLCCRKALLWLSSVTSLAPWVFFLGLVVALLVCSVSQPQCSWLLFLYPCLLLTDKRRASNVTTRRSTKNKKVWVKGALANTHDRTKSHDAVRAFVGRRSAPSATLTAPR